LLVYQLLAVVRDLWLFFVGHVQGILFLLVGIGSRKGQIDSLLFLFSVVVHPPPNVTGMVFLFGLVLLFLLGLGKKQLILVYILLADLVIAFEIDREVNGLVEAGERHLHFFS